MKMYKMSGQILQESFMAKLNVYRASDILVET
jgi:hypothetical protein